MKSTRRTMIKGLLAGSLAGVTSHSTLLAQGMGTPGAMHGQDSSMGQHQAGTGTSAAYMEITNNGNEPDTLIAASTDVAETVEIHTVVMEGDVMKMQELEDGLKIPAGETVVLERGSYHVMLINLTTDLLEGDEYTLTLEFENAGEVEIPVVVANEAPEDSVVDAGDLVITGAILRPAPMLMAQATPQAHGGMNTGTSAVFMHVTNHGSEPDTLVGAQSDVAELAEVHEMRMQGDLMKMQELKDGLEIPAGETVVLERGGYHIMLINLTRDMHEGDEIELTLEFDVAGDIELTVPVTMMLPDGDSVTQGDIEITGAFARPAPMLGGDDDAMDATPDPQ